MNKTIGMGLGLAAATVLALIAGLFAASPVGAQDDFISLDSATVNITGEADIDLVTSGIGQPGLGAWDIGIAYDPDIVEPESCTSNAGSQCNINFASDQVQIVGASGDGHVGTTTLATIVFGCVSEGSTSVSLVVSDFADATEGSPQPLSYGVVNGQITCVEPEGVPTNPRPRPSDDDDDDADVDDDTGAPTNGGVSGLPKTGSGAAGGGGTATWFMIVLASVGLASMTGFGAMRLSARRSSEETQGD
ncbi:MAG: hypothetical protein WD939_04495 [Dehalococcoidia bacterium]